MINRGDVETIRTLVENGVDCSRGDYDKRTVVQATVSGNQVIFDFNCALDLDAQDDSLVVEVMKSGTMANTRGKLYPLLQPVGALSWTKSERE